MDVSVTAENCTSLYSTYQGYVTVQFGRQLRSLKKMARPSSVKHLRRIWNWRQQAPLKRRHVIDYTVSHSRILQSPIDLRN